MEDLQEVFSIQNASTRCFPHRRPLEALRYIEEASRESSLYRRPLGGLHLQGFLYIEDPQEVFSLCIDNYIEGLLKVIAINNIYISIQKASIKKLHDSPLQQVSRLSFLWIRSPAGLVYIEGLQRVFCIWKICRRPVLSLQGAYGRAFLYRRPLGGPLYTGHLQESVSIWKAQRKSSLHIRPLGRLFLIEFIWIASS